jgi:toxin ParE1/3/4
MAGVQRSPQAEADLESILGDLNLKDPAVADRYAAAFDEKGQALARFPEIGRRRPEIAANVLSTLVPPYVLFYRIDGETVQILRILHGKRDLRHIMREESGE